MRLRDENQRTGHLLSFISKDNRDDNFSFFFPVKGLNQFDSLLEITAGFERVLQKYWQAYESVGYSIADFSRMEDPFPEVNRRRVSIFEQDEFLSEDCKFMDDFGEIIIDRHMRKHEPIFPGIITGAMATGSSFYDRRDKIEEIWEDLEKGNNILLRAPRRYGKSSMLHHISRNPPKKWRVCFVDLEGGKSPEDFVEYLLVKGMFLEKDCNLCLPDRLSVLDIHGKTEIEKADIIRQERKKIQQDWQSYAKELFSSIEDKSGGDRFLFILDEFTFLIEDMLENSKNNPDTVNVLLEWFRGIRDQTGRIQFVLSGSEHLPTFLKRFKINGVLEDLNEVHLGLFDEKTSREFVFLVLSGQKVVAPRSEIDHILHLMGSPIPYFLQLFLDAVCRKCKEEQSLSLYEIENVYYGELLGSGSKRYFESIRKQLERYNRYGPRSRAGAEGILDQLAMNDSVALDTLKVIWQEITDRDEHFETILGLMQDDFYIKEDNHQALFFGSKLLKDWWRKHGLSGLR
jgi:hypothetical protein